MSSPGPISRCTATDCTLLEKACQQGCLRAYAWALSWAGLDRDLPSARFEFGLCWCPLIGVVRWLFRVAEQQDMTVLIVARFWSVQGREVSIFMEIHSMLLNRHRRQYTVVVHRAHSRNTCDVCVPQVFGLYQMSLEVMR